MKQKLFILPLLVTIALAGCSKKEIGQDPTPSRYPNSGYVAVNLVAPKGIVGKADAFEVGDENKVDKIMFLFFDENGNSTQTPWVETGIEMNETDIPNVEKISSTVVVIAGQVSPTQMLVVINPQGSTDDYKDKTLSEIRRIIHREQPYYEKDGNDYFLMTNSVYADENEAEHCAESLVGKVFEERSELNDPNNAVNIYVERVAAKVNAKAADEFNNAEQQAEKISENLTLYRQIKGIYLTNTVSGSYLFKNIEGYENWADQLSNWNDLTNKRCYWANTPAIAPDPEVEANDNISVTQASWDDVAAMGWEGESTWYLLENTSDVKTAVMVAAQFTKDSEGNTPAAFVKWGGAYYEKDDFLNQYAHILNNLGYKVDGGIFTADDLMWIEYDSDRWSELVADGTLTNYQTTAMVKVEPGVERAYTKNDNETTVEDINNELLTDNCKAMMWEGGRSYYYVNIEHPTPQNVIDDYAVVRNHFYKLNLNSISGIGIPVIDAERPIEPDQPIEEKLFYVGAQINVLQWAVQTQEVNFN